MVLVSRIVMAKLVGEETIYLTGCEKRHDEAALFVTVGDVLDARACLAAPVPNGREEG